MLANVLEFQSWYWKQDFSDTSLWDIYKQTFNHKTQFNPFHLRKDAQDTKCQNTRPLPKTKSKTSKDYQTWSNNIQYPALHSADVIKLQ